MLVLAAFRLLGEAYAKFLKDQCIRQIRPAWVEPQRPANNHEDLTQAGAHWLVPHLPG